MRPLMIALWTCAAFLIVLMFLALSKADAFGASSAFSTKASAMAGRPLTVTCDGPPLGEQYGSRVLLAPGVCQRLRVAPRVVGGQLPTSLAILVFAHEVAHARGLFGEMAAECWAAANFTRTARVLGFTKVAQLRAQLVPETFCPRGIR